MGSLAKSSIAKDQNLVHYAHYSNRRELRRLPSGGAPRRFGLREVSVTKTHRSIWGHLRNVDFKQAWVDAGGVRTRYVEAGPPDAPVVLMVHGTASSWECFCANLEAYSRTYRCLAIDLMGTGFSDKPDYDYEIPTYVKHMKDFLDALGIERASLMGVSLGAWASSRFALTHPDVVEKMILLAPSGRIINRATLKRTKGVRNKAVDDPSWENIKPVFNSILYAEEDRIDDLVALRQAIYLQPEMKKGMEHILCLQEEEVRERNLISDAEWSRIDVPVLIILAPDDHEDYYTTGMAISTLMPNAETYEIKHVKHWAHFESPEEFNRVSLAFLAKSAP